MYPLWVASFYIMFVRFTILLYVAFILFILLSRSSSVLQLEKLRLKDFKELAMATRFGQELSPKSNSCLFLLCNRHAACQLSSLILKPDSVNPEQYYCFYTWFGGRICLECSGKMLPSAVDKLHCKQQDFLDNKVTRIRISLDKVLGKRSSCVCQAW